jgi:hypothetical protein
MVASQTANTNALSDASTLGISALPLPVRSRNPSSISKRLQRLKALKQAKHQLPLGIDGIEPENSMSATLAFSYLTAFEYASMNNTGLDKTALSACPKESESLIKSAGKASSKSYVAK